MSNQFSTLTDLEEFRSILLIERQRIVGKALDAHRGGDRQTINQLDTGAAFQRVQEQIEAVERAINDEKSKRPGGRF